MTWRHLNVIFPISGSGLHKSIGNVKFLSHKVLKASCRNLARFQRYGEYPEEGGGGELNVPWIRQYLFLAIDESENYRINCVVITDQ